MTEPQPLEKDREPRHWIVQTFGLAFGLAVLIIAIVTVVVMGLESPSTRRAAVRAAPIATASQPAVVKDTAPDRGATDAPIAAPGPTQMPVTKPTVASAPTQTSFVVSLPLVSNRANRTVARATTRTPIPTATVKSASRLVATRAGASQSSAPSQRRLAVTARPVATLAPLNFSFNAGSYCVAPGTQKVRLMITAHGGQPPYAYYNDANLLGKTEGTVWYELEAPAGNPVPFKLIVIDATGQKYTEEFFLKTRLHCGF